MRVPSERGAPAFGQTCERDAHMRLAGNRIYAARAERDELKFSIIYECVRAGPIAGAEFKINNRPSALAHIHNRRGKKGEEEMRALKR